MVDWALKITHLPVLERWHGHYRDPRALSGCNDRSESVREVKDTRGKDRVESLMATVNTRLRP